MNNEQFRRLLGSNSSTSQSSTSPAAKPRSLLGARPKSTSQTGRSGGASLFKKASGGNEQKKVKTSVPKGTKLAAGYIDRTKEKREDEDEDETAQKLKALEERLKGDEIDQETFEKLRDEITAGDISRTHLVKGLDRKLLERVRRGEDVLAENAKTAEGGEDQSVLDDDEAFDELEQHEVVAAVREERVKQGEKSKIVPAPLAGQKRSRNQILADLKAQREAAKAAARPQLGTGFKKIRKDDGPRIEVDEKGREILITTDEHGNVKRRVKKAKVMEDVKTTKIQDEIKKPLKSKDRPLGADVNVPVFEPLPQEESDGDIFESVGHDFNPLADLEDDDSGDEQTKELNKVERPEDTAPSTMDDDSKDSGSEEGEAKEPPPTITTTAAAKNYFNDDPSSFSVLGNIKNNFSDPNVIAALARSQRSEMLSEAPQNESAEEKAKRKRREAMLSRQDRDMEDMDMGFGGSRFDDAQEMDLEGSKQKFSKWKGLGEEDDDEEGEGVGGKKRKRGAKKRKGDKNSAADVMKVMESQKKG
jgi:hypothetical protein